MRKLIYKRRAVYIDDPAWQQAKKTARGYKPEITISELIRRALAAYNPKEK